MSYYDIYQKRLGRYGNTVQERMKNQRILLFEKYKAQSVYQIPFADNEGKLRTAVFEPYKQNETKFLSYLLTDLDIELQDGWCDEIFDLDNKSLGKWMVFYLEENHSRGYNKYVMLRMSHVISINGMGEYPCYCYGQMSTLIEDLVASRKADVWYEDKDKDGHIIMPALDIKKDDYIIVNGDENEPYLVTGFDKITIPGVIYIALNETMTRDTKEVDFKDNIWG